MVLQCCICKKTKFLYPDLTFHTFPTNIDDRAIWLSNLGEEKRISKNSRICSAHFSQEDFEIKPSGRKFLKIGAIPASVVDPESMPGPKTIQSIDTTTHTNFEKDINCPGSSSMKRSSVIMNIPPSSNVSPDSASDDSFQINIDSPCPSIKRRKIESDNDQLQSDMSTTITVSDISNTFSASDMSNNEASDIEKVLTINASHEQAAESFSTLSASETELVQTLITEDMDNSYIEEDRKTKPLSKMSKKKETNAVHEMTSSSFSTPTKAKRNFRKLKYTVISQKRKIRTLQQSVRRLKSRVTSLNTLIKLLEQKTLLHENCEAPLKASLPESVNQLFERMLKGHRNQKYTPALRSFALTLSFYSTRAYNFVRKTFNKSLPHPTTLSKWYQSINGAPGWTQEALNTLKAEASEAKEKNKTVVCNLVFDEMSIRKQIEWTGKKFCGYVDIGTDFDSDELPQAKEVLVFMLVSVNCSWKIPVGYFLLDGLRGSEKAALVRKCLELVHDTGVLVTSITCDGAPANLKMAADLGADFRIPIKSYFSHPVTQEKVFIFLDPCHMIKLVRNCLGSEKILEDHEKNQINWSYVDKLVDIQYNQGLHAATKLRKRHIMWTKEKMKVKIATQTLSKSVADSLLYLCKDLCLSEFRGAEATAQFIQYFNDLFDMFNSKNRFAKYLYKKPLSPKTKEQFFKYLDEIKEYIVHLSSRSVNILESRRKTGFLGFLICIESLKGLYETYLENDNVLKYILTYKLSQDHLELFFGSVRSRGGFNNNPTARQFEAAYKRLIVHTEIKAGDTGNAINLDATSILFCSSGKLTENEVLDQAAKQNTLEEQLEADIHNLDYINSSAWNLTDYVDDIVCYIAGFVSRSLNNSVTCSTCKRLLVDENDKTFSKLQKRKEYKNLTKASLLTIRTCKEAEKYFRFFNKTTNIYNWRIKNLMNILVTKTIQNIPKTVYEYFGDHLYDEDVINGHSIQLLKLVLEKYFKIRINHETKKKLDSATILRIRSVLTKTVLFRNQ